MKLAPGIRWPLLVVGILLTSLVVCALTVLASLSDRSYAVESNYYEQAVRWDESARERDASALLGWTSEATLRTDTGVGDLTLALFDQDHAPLAGATVEAEVFHHARRKEAVILTLNENDGGRYTGIVTPAPDGVWSVRVRATLGDALYIINHDIESRRGPRD